MHKDNFAQGQFCTKTILHGEKKKFLILLTLNFFFTFTITPNH